MKIKDTSDIRRVEAEKPFELKKAQAAKARTEDTVTTGAAEKARAAVAAAAADRAARIEAIEAALRSGAFKPDPERIAQRILADAELSAMLQAMLAR